MAPLFSHRLIKCQTASEPEAQKLHPSRIRVKKMKKKLKKMTMLLCVATNAAGIVSCGNNAKKDVEETPTSYSQTRANRGNVGDALPICNTKWGFTDAQGNRFTLTIKEMARDRKSAKMELEKNGMVVVYGTVGPD